MDLKAKAAVAAFIGLMLVALLIQLGQERGVIAKSENAANTTAKKESHKIRDVEIAVSPGEQSSIPLVATLPG